MKAFASILCLILFFCNGFLHAQSIDKKLEQKVQEHIRGFKGQIGIYIKSLRTGKQVLINADTIFPTASIVKVPILIGIMDKIERKELDYHMHLYTRDTLYYDPPAEDIAPYLKPGSPIELSKLIMLMMTISDNNASLWLQSLAGTGTRINQLMDSMGYVYTRVNSRTPGREANRSVFGWGQTTPMEMGRLMESFVKGEVISAVASDRMLRIMGRQYWDEEALSSLPPSVFVASKNGAVNASRSELLFVNAPHPYILGIFTKNNQDQRWTAENEAWTLTRELTKMIHGYFNRP